MVKILYDETILQNRSLQISILGEIVSEKNSLLSTQSLKSIINPCYFLTFNLSITLTSDNSLLLSFYQKLLSPLTQQNIELYISSVKDFSFALNEYSVSSYFINITYNENIENNSSLTFKFSNPIYSVCNDSLSILEYYFILNPTVLSYEAAVSYKSEQTSTTVTQSKTIGSLLLSLLNLNFITL